MVNSKFEKRVTALEKSLAKSEQWSRKNNVEFNYIPKDITDSQLKSKVFRIATSRVWKLITITLRIVIPSLFQDIVEVIKRVIVKFVNRKHSKTLLYKKKSLSSRNLSNINMPNKTFLSVSFYPYYRFIWGECKDLQRRAPHYV